MILRLEVQIVGFRGFMAQFDVYNTELQHGGLRWPDTCSFQYKCRHRDQVDKGLAFLCLLLLKQVRFEPYV